MEKGKKTGLLIYLILLVYAAYGVYFIYSSSTVINGTRYFLLADDAMVSMRYAKNFASGHGLVWNPGGERVEGYTNFLWVMIMSLPHFFNFPLWQTSLFVQSLSLFLLLLSVYFIYLIALKISSGNIFASLAAGVAAASYFSSTYWSLVGMETGLISFFCALIVYLLADQTGDKPPSNIIYVLLSLIIFSRADGFVLSSCIAIFIAMTEPTNKRRPVVLGIITVLGSLVLITLFRLFYYHDILPNTYYLKMTGYPLFLRITRGLIVFMQSILKVWLIPFVIPFIVLRPFKNRIFSLSVLIFCVQSLYSIYAGGDAWEEGMAMNRFITISMPLFCMTVVLALWHLSETLIKKPGTSKLTFILAVSIVIALINTPRGKASLNDIFNPSGALNIPESKHNLNMAMLLGFLTKPEARVAIVRAGVMPYFIDRYYIDTLGKNDRHIAKVLMKQSDMNKPLIEALTYFYPGHLKTDNLYVINECNPEMIWEMWDLNPELINYLNEKYYYFCDSFFVIKTMTNINHENLKTYLKDNIAGCK